MAADAGIGAVKGAAQGFAAGGVPGAIVGAIGGFFSGQSAARARVYANRAAKTQKALGYMEAAIQRRDMIRQARASRAESLAAITAGGEGGMLSSAPMGALSSLTSQTGQNLRYFDARIRDFVQMQFWANKAAKKQAQAANIQGLTTALSSLGSLYKPPATPSQTTAVPSSIPSGSGYPTVNNNPIGTSPETR